MSAVPRSEFRVRDDLVILDATSTGITRHRTRAVWTVIVGALLAGCSLVDREAGNPEPCEPADRTVILESTTLANEQPSAAFDVSAGREVFVTLLADPEFYDGAGLTSGLLHSSVFVIADGDVPQPGGLNEEGFARRSPDFRVPRYDSVGESRFLDRPDGSYRLWGSLGPVVEVFSCPSG